MLSSEQFYLKENTLVFNKLKGFNLLKILGKDIVKTTDFIKIDLRSVDEIPKNFFKNFIDLLSDINVNGVLMYLSKELDYIMKDYQEEVSLSSSNHSNSNSFVIFDSSDKVDILFFNGIENTSINMIKDNLLSYKNKKVVFNFSNLNIESLSKFIPSFMGWMMNSGLKKISFSKHYGEINDLLEKRGIYCMFNVSTSISFPKRKKQECKYVNNKKIDRFLKFANYAALQF